MMRTLAAIGAAVGVVAPAVAEIDSVLPAHALTLDVAAAMSADPEPKAEPVAAGSGASGRTPYGVSPREGTQWYCTLGTGVAYDFDEDTDFNLFANFSLFPADKLEVFIEVGAWYFAQHGPDTGGGSFAFGARYHFYETLVEGTDERDWTVFAEAAVGMLIAGNEVPTGGTNVNFMPRVGVGFTKRLSEDLRLLVSVRWNHISNGRIAGDSDNPARNGIMGVVGVVFPF